MGVGSNHGTVFRQTSHQNGACVSGPARLIFHGCSSKAPAYHFNQKRALDDAADEQCCGHRVLGSSSLKGLLCETDPPFEFSSPPLDANDLTAPHACQASKDYFWNSYDRTRPSQLNDRRSKGRGMTNSHHARKAQSSLALTPSMTKLYSGMPIPSQVANACYLQESRGGSSRQDHVLLETCRPFCLDYRRL